MKYYGFSSDYFVKLGDDKTLLTKQGKEWYTVYVMKQTYVTMLPTEYEYPRGVILVFWSNSNEQLVK